MLDQAVAGSGTGPLEYLIPVVYDPVAHTLSILHPSLSIRPGDRVVWVFQGVAGDWSPWIQFKAESGDPRGFLGPFEGLNQIAGGFWGASSPQLTSGTFTYRACVQQGAGLDWQTGTALLCSSQATLEVSQEEAPLDPARFVVTSSAQEVAPGVGALLVSPEQQQLDSGQAVVWDFEPAVRELGDPGHWRPRVNFHLYEGDGSVPNQLLGPFTCLVYEAAKVTGLGNTGVAGSYHFEVSLISISAGEATWISSGDPVIDNRGTVVDPVSG